MRILPILIILALSGGVASGQSPAPVPTEESTMTASGEFDVTMIPQQPDGEAAGPFGRLWLDKTYRGALAATSRGQMIAFRSAVEGSAGYAALEQVTGTLDGRQGSFVLLHHGLMDHGTPTAWSVTVVPDSGTDALAGLAGEMRIVIDGNRHAYVLEYTLGGD